MANILPSQLNPTGLTEFLITSRSFVITSCLESKGVLGRTVVVGNEFRLAFKDKKAAEAFLEILRNAISLNDLPAWTLLKKGRVRFAVCDKEVIGKVTELFQKNYYRDFKHPKLDWMRAENDIIMKLNDQSGEWEKIDCMQSICLKDRCMPKDKGPVPNSFKLNEKGYFEKDD